jgi:outer membrane protein OmpA-like peptidoglycan-associated protein
MIKSGNSVIAWIAFPIALALATSGCATKKYVKQQVAPVHKQVAALEKQTNDKISFLNNKVDRDISATNERISTVDQRVTQVAEATQQAQGTASRAMETADANTGKITTLQSNVANALNYQLTDRADVFFAFDKAELTSKAKQTLNEIIAKAQTMPRSVIEIAGFTDPRGSRNWNYALSRRRAQSVERYLVMQKVPPRSISIVGLGKLTPPSDFQPENPVPAGASRAARYQGDRRVQVRLFGAGDLSGGTASREQEQQQEQQPDQQQEQQPDQQQQQQPDQQQQQQPDQQQQQQQQ